MSVNSVQGNKPHFFFVGIIRKIQISSADRIQGDERDNRWHCTCGKHCDLNGETGLGF